MIRYRVDYISPKNDKSVLIALTDYRDVGEIIKNGIEGIHPEYRVRVVDRAPTGNLFSRVEGE